jgi:hypothetical protein
MLAVASAGVSGDAATQTTWIRTVYRVRDIQVFMLGVRLGVVVK